MWPPAAEEMQACNEALGAMHQGNHHGHLNEQKMILVPAAEKAKTSDEAVGAMGGDSDPETLGRGNLTVLPAAEKPQTFDKAPGAIHAIDKSEALGDRFWQLKGCRPVMKLLVPSMGSMTQRYSACPAWPGQS